MVELFFVLFSGHAEVILSAHYTDSVNQYGHFALGKPHEYSTVVARTDQGRALTFKLPEGQVFEDLEPRMVQLVPGTEKQLLTIVSGFDGGARLFLLHLEGERLAFLAQSPPIGRAMRWLNPVGVADLDGDGQVEIAAVITPHIGGTLKVYSVVGNRMVEKAALGNFSNHILGSTEQGLSTLVEMGNQTMLVVPDSTRSRLRLVAFVHGQLVELGSHPLAEPLRNKIKSLGDGWTEVAVDPFPFKIDWKPFQTGKK